MLQLGGEAVAGLYDALGGYLLGGVDVVVGQVDAVDGGLGALVVLVAGTLALARRRGVA